MTHLRGLLGLAVILAIAFLVSNNRGRIRWRTAVVGLAIQIAFAVLVLRWSVGKDVLDFVSGQVRALIDYTNAGIDFLFGKLAADKKNPIFALQVLPVIVFIGALVGLLYYLRVIQWIVQIVGGAIAWATEEPASEGGVRDVRDTESANAIHATARGAISGGRIAVIVGCLLIAFISLIALGNGLLSGVGGWFGYDGLTFQKVLGWAFSPRLGLKALLAGSLVNLANAAIAGVVVG